jgi:hypothetical protein
MPTNPPWWYPPPAYGAFTDFLPRQLVPECIAAHNGAAIGQHVADALDTVGKDGGVTLDEVKTMQTEPE